MSVPASPDVTALLLAWREGDLEALDRLTEAVYAELKRLAHWHLRAERTGNPLQTTALVHEAYLRLIDGSRVPWQNRAHFLAVAAKVMRHVLVDIARRSSARKRGADPAFAPLDVDLPDPDTPRPDLLAVDEALDRLAAFDARKAKVVELRYFGGLTVEETAAALAVSPDTVTRDWKVARLWLLRALGPATGAANSASRPHRLPPPPSGEPRRNP